MQHFSFAVLAALAWATPVAAQQAATEPAAVEQAPKWRAAVSGGVTLVPDFDTQTHAGLSLTRQFDGSYLQLGVGWVDAGRSLGVVNPVPATAFQGTLAAGTSLAAFSLDGYVTLGERQFATELIGPGGQRARAEAGGSSFGAGLTLTYDLPVGSRGFLSPFVAADYHAIDIARAVTTSGGNQIAATQRQDGWSGSFGLAYQHAFGPGGAHSLGPYAAYVVSSDNAAVTPGPGGLGLAQTLAVRGGGINDQWVDLGASASFALSRRLRLRLSAAQTLGFEGADSTALATGLSLVF